MPCDNPTLSLIVNLWFEIESYPSRDIQLDTCLKTVNEQRKHTDSDKTNNLNHKNSFQDMIVRKKSS